MPLLTSRFLVCRMSPWNEPLGLGAFLRTKGIVAAQARLAKRKGPKPSSLLIIWLLQQAPTGSVEGAPTSVSQDASPVSVRLCHRGGLPEVSGGLSLAGWVHLPSMRARKIV